MTIDPESTTSTTVLAHSFPRQSSLWPTPLAVLLLWTVCWVAFRIFECSFAMIPLVIGTVFFYLGRRWFDEKRQALLWLLSLLVAHAGWGWKGGILIVMGRHINDQQAMLLMELSIYSAAIIWLACKPGPVPLYMLLLYTSFSLLMNIMSLPPFGTDVRVNRGLLLHIGLRLAMFRFFLQALSEEKQPRSDIPEVPL